MKRSSEKKNDEERSVGLKYKRYLVKTNSDREDFNADLDYSIINFSETLLIRLAGLKEAFDKQMKLHKDILTWSLRDSSVQFFSLAAAEAMLGEEVMDEIRDSDHPFKLPDAAVIDERKYDVALSDEVVISDIGLWWKVFPSHTEISVGSEFISWPWFDQCCNCGLRRAEHARGHCLFSPTRYRATVPELAGPRKARRDRAGNG